VKIQALAALVLIACSTNEGAHRGNASAGAAGEAGADGSVAGAGGSAGTAQEAGSEEAGSGGRWCGSPVPPANYEACTNAQTPADCAANGGTWDPIFGINYIPTCICPTGDGDCTCDQPSDCVEDCIVPEKGSCAGLVQGKCQSMSAIIGCYCFFTQDGGPLQATDRECLD